MGLVWMSQTSGCLQIHRKFQVCNNSSKLTRCRVWARERCSASILAGGQRDGHWSARPRGRARWTDSTKMRCQSRTSGSSHCRKTGDRFSTPELIPTFGSAVQPGIAWHFAAVTPTPHNYNVTCNNGIVSYNYTEMGNRCGFTVVGFVQ